MCTVTVVPSGDGFRLGCNRDERRDRALASLPSVHHLPHRTAIFPVDPLGQGTWVGVNGAGVAAALLNRTIDSAVPIDKSSRRSRGLIHYHQWPRRRDISVKMERADATTVSHTVVNVSSRASELRYRALESAKRVAVTAA